MDIFDTSLGIRDCKTLQHSPLPGQGEQGPGGVGAEAEPVPQLVEEDPAQPTCAISGETFERMYDPDTDKWYFEDAVVLWGEQASNAGVMEGSIVKVGR